MMMHLPAPLSRLSSPLLFIGWDWIEMMPASCFSCAVLQPIDRS
jgi:hypothetical protein